MLRMVARDIAIAVTTPARDPEMRVMSAASMATSVPVPMARPTSAAARAGASLIPSPVMPTLRPSACSRWTSAALCSGSTSGSTRRTPVWRAIAAAVVALSPVSMTTSTPSRCRAAIAAGGVVLDRVGDRQHSGRDAVHGRQYGGLALRGQLGGHRVERGGAGPGAGQQPGAAGQDGMAVHGGLNALAGDGIKAGQDIPPRGNDLRPRLAGTSVP